jgi:microcystin-dependent protein
LPLGFLFCDGSSLSQSAFARLFAVIGTSYGGTGSTFNLPDTRSQMLRGSATMASSSGGSDTSSVLLANLANHNHAFGASATASQASHSHVPNPNVSHTHNLLPTTTNRSSGSQVADVYSENGTLPPETFTTNAQTLLTSTAFPKISASGTTESTGSGTAFATIPSYVPVPILIRY